MFNFGKILIGFILCTLIFSYCKKKEQPPVPKPVVGVIDTVTVVPRDSFWWVGIDTFTFSVEKYNSQTISIPYRLLIPPNLLKEGRKYPMSMILHGSNMRGSDNDKQIHNGLVEVWHGWEQYVQKRPTIVVVPQCPSNMYWTDLDVYTALYSLLNDLIIQYPISVDSMYISGFSIGGTGVFKMLNEDPSRWAAACAVSSYTTSYVADPNNFYPVPLRIFISQGDSVFNYDNALAYYQSIWVAKGNADTINDSTDADLQLFAFPDSSGLGHNIIDTVVAREDYLDFFYSRGK